MSPQMVVWNPDGLWSPGSLEELAKQALTAGGHQALCHWQNGNSGAADDARSAADAGTFGASSTTHASVAHVHGEQHDLWWEFTLEASFRWQAHLCRLRPEVYQQRLHRLTRSLGIESLLSREVASLTHSSRTLADLAVALMPHPDLLLWEEPFYLVGQSDARRAIRLVQEMSLGGMALVAVAAHAPGLDDLQAEAPLPTRPHLHLAR